MKTCTVTSNVGPPTEFQIPELGDPCEKCRAKPSTREVMIMVERPGGVVYYCDDCASPPIAPAPQWSTTPPREPGQRWAKHLRTDEAEIVDVYESADGELTVVRLGDSCAFGLHEFALWWPVRIEPPR